MVQGSWAVEESRRETSEEGDSFSTGAEAVIWRHGGLSHAGKRQPRVLVVARHLTLTPALLYTPSASSAFTLDLRMACPISQTRMRTQSVWENESEML